MAAVLLASQTSAHVGHIHGSHADAATAVDATRTDATVMDAAHGHESHATAPCLVCRLGGAIAPAPSLALVPPPPSTPLVAQPTTTDASHDSLLLSGSGPRGPPIRV